MPYKERTVPEVLKGLRILDKRSKLTEESKKYLNTLEKGYEGELKFDLLTEKMSSSCLILNDLSLDKNNSKFQIDTTILFQETIYMLEVKNFEGEYIYDSENFKTFSGMEVKNPLDQLKRSKLLLRQLLQANGFNLHIEAFVIFINPEFTLYNTPPNLPFILPTQLDRFMKKLDSKVSKLTSFHTKLADKLVSLHKPEPPKLPLYKYETLQKGLYCFKCYSFSVMVQGTKVVCCDCGTKELVETAVMRNVEEIKFLFPSIKITTNVVHDWCRVVHCKRKIRRVLGRYMETKGLRQWTFYE